MSRSKRSGRSICLGAERLSRTTRRDISTVSTHMPIPDILKASLTYPANEKDITRDLLIFVTAYLRLHSSHDLPAHLEPRRPGCDPKQPTRQHLHVVAHSLGAQAAILASVHAPAIFSSLTVADLAIISPGKINDALTKLPKDVLCLGFPERYPDGLVLTEELRKNKHTRG